MILGCAALALSVLGSGSSFGAAAASGDGAAPRDFSAKSYIAVDGSKLVLAPVKGGLTRALITAGGTSTITTYNFLGGQFGTISEGGPKHAVGLFTIDQMTIAAAYADGRSEWLTFDGDDAASLRATAADGEIACSAWFGAGHQFSLEERKVALAGYARRLGISDPRYRLPAGGGCPPENKTRPGDATARGTAQNASAAAGARPDTLSAIMARTLAMFMQQDGTGGAGDIDSPAWRGFEKFYSAFLARHEGGYTENDGNGSPANFGINQGANPDIEVASLTQAAAKQILFERYWLASGADRLPAPLALVHGDTAVNFGVRAANDLLAQSGGDADTYLDLRNDRYVAIATPNPDKAKYLPIWLARSEDLRSLIRNGEGVAANDDAFTAGRSELIP